MARTKFNQRSANRVDVPMGATGGRPPSKFSIAVLAVSILTAVWAAAMLTPFGRVGYYYLFVYSEYYMGVLTLVSLSITIMVGLVATDRLVLSIRQRVLLQSAHRTTGVIAVGSLMVHVWTKTIEQHVRAIDIVVPFLAPYNTVYVGLGTVSGWIMMLVMWTGLARAKFIGRGRPWMWRAIHAISYLMWPIALVHGLAAGRSAATWVIVSYVVCVLFVLVGLAVRLSVSLNRNKDFASTSTGSIKPVGSVPTQSPSVKKRTPARRPESHPAAAPDTWLPAAAARGSAAPVSAQPGRLSGRPISAPAGAVPMSGMPVSGSPYDPEPRRRYADDDEERAPRRRYADDEPVPRSRRGAGRHSRSELVDLAPPADPWEAQVDSNYMEPDETPTLVDIASRRARRQAQQDVRGAGRRARRSRARSADDALDDVQYWRQLRGEAR